MNIREIRQAYPQYNDLSDKQLADALRERFYADIPVGEFYQKIGLNVAAPTTAGDIFTALKTGALGSAKALTDVFGADNAASAALQRKLEETQKQYSPARQAEMAREEAERKRAAESGSMLEEAKVFGRQVLESPLQATAGAIGSFAPYLPTMLLGPITAALGLSARGVAAATAVANAAPKVIGTAQGAGAVKGAMYESVYKAEREAGVSEEEARAKAVAAQDYFGKNIDQIVLGGGVGLLAGSSGVEKLLTPTGAKGAAPGMLRRVGQAMAVEAPTEGVQGAQEQFAANLAQTREGREVPLMQGVMGAGVQEAMMGALGAGPIAALRGGPAAEEQRRIAAEQQAREAARIAADEQRQAAEQAAFRQTPQYLDDIEQRYTALAARQKELEDARKVKAEGADPAAVEIANRQRKEAAEALKDFKDSDEYKQTMEEYIAVYPQLSKRKKEAAAVEKTFGKQPLYEAEDLSPAAQAKRLQDQIAALQKQQAKLPTPAAQQPIQNQINALQGSLDELTPTQAEFAEAQRRLNAGLNTAKQQLATATDTAAMQRHTDTISRVEQALAELEKLGPYVKKEEAAQPSLFELREQVDKAQEVGDVEALQRLTPMLAEAEKQPELPFATGYASENQLADEIARGREEAAKRSKAVEKETEALLRVGTKDLSPFALALKKQRLEEARGVLRAAQRAKMGPQPARAKSAGVEYQVLPGGKLSQGTAVSTLIRRNEQDWAALNDEIKSNTPRQTDREQLAKDLSKKQVELEDQIETASQYGPSPALRLLRSELDSIQKALEDIKLKQEIGRRHLERKPVAPLTGRWERPNKYREGETDVKAASDARVADLIERLLPVATALKGAEKEARPLVGMQPSLFDVEAQQKIARRAAETTLPGQITRKIGYEESEETGRAKKTDITTGERPAPRSKQEAPIESAQDLLDKMKLLSGTLKTLNKEIQKLGRTKKEDELARLEQLKSQRDFTLDEIERTRAAYTRLADLQTPAFEAKEEAPTTEDLFGPLEEARAEKNRIQDELDDLYAKRDQLRADLQRRGQVAATPQLQELVDRFSKETPTLRATEDQIEKLERELERVSGKTSERFQEFAQAREREREEVADTRTRTLPGFERRAGVRPVSETKLRELRTELVALQNLQRDLEKARASADVDPTRYLRQIAVQKQEELDAFYVQSDDPITKTWPLQKQKVLQSRYTKKITPTARDIEYYDGLRKQIAYYGNIVKGRNKRVVETALETNFAQQDKLRDEIAQLESRQRAYEQQEAVRAGATAGEAEAQRLIAGGGYRTASGALRTKPKKLSSWGITEITKKTLPVVAPAKVTATASMLQQYQRETEAAAQAGAAAKETLDRKVARATKNIERLSSALGQIYSTETEKKTEEQITNLLAPGFTPEQRASLRDMAQVYTNLKNSVAGNTTADVIARLEAEKARLVEAQGRFSAVRGDEEKKAKTTYQERITDTNNLINDLKRQPKTLDPWVAALTSITKELDAKALTASQEADFAQKVYDAADRARAQVQEKIDALYKKPMMSTFATQMSNLEYQYDQQLERLQEANVDLNDKNTAYRLARLEQLNFLKAYGQDLKNTIAVEADTVQSLQPQLAEQAKTNKELEDKLKKATQMLAAKRVEDREAAAKPVAAPPYVYSKEEKAALDRIRTGLGLPGTRYTTDTTSTLVTKTRRYVRNTLALAQAELAAAQQKGDVAEVQKQTARVQQLERDYESVMQIGERVIEPVGEGAENRDVERVEPAAVEGARLPRRRVGPVTRVGTQPPSQMISGTAESREAISKGNRPSQAGTVRLTADDLSIDKASAISLSVLKQKLDAATGDRKAQLQAAYDEATNGMDAAQIKAKIKEGNDLIAVPGASTVVTARERERAAWATYQKAQADVKEAKTPAAKEIARDAEEAAQQAWELADRQLDAAKAAVAAGFEPDATPKKRAEDAIEDALRGESRVQSAIGGVDDEGTPTIFRDRPETSLSGEMLEAVNDGRLLDALDLIAANGENQLLRDNAAKARAMVLRTRLVAAPNLTYKGEPVPALYSARDNAIYYRPGFVAQEDVVHEATHAAVNRGLDVPMSELSPEQQRARKEIEAIFARLEKRPDLKREYGLKDKFEFAAELQSNQDFRDTLRDMKYYGDSMLKRLVNLFLELIGFRKPELLVPAAQRAIEALYMPSRKYEMRETAAALSEAEFGKWAVAERRVADLTGRLQRQQKDANEEYAKVASVTEKYGAAKGAVFREQADYLQAKADKTAAELAEAQKEFDALDAQRGTPSIFRTAARAEEFSSVVGRPAGTMETLKGNLFGLSGRVQLVDKLAAADAALIRAENAGAISDYEAFQTQYFLRLADMTSQAAGQFISNGPVKIVAQQIGGRKEYRYESVNGANLVNVSNYMEQAAKAGLGTPEQVETLLTVVIAGDRANALPNGWKRLFTDNPAAAKAEYDRYQQQLRQNPTAARFIESAKAEYKKYNDGLLDFMEQTGFLSADEVKRLKKTPYVPYYRIENGEVRLFTDRETSIRIGNIKDTPDLQRMVGDNKNILPILTSAVQNTFMLSRMGLQNKAKIETANSLNKAGFVSKMGKGYGPANVNTVHYKMGGEPVFAVIDSDTFGVPADLIVKGMEGIKTVVPEIVRMMGLPADWIRKFVTRSPAYIIRQLIRDPVNAAIVGGVNGTPVLNAIRELAKMRTGGSPEAEKLQRGLVVSSNVFTGNEQDMTLFLESIATGRGKWSKLMSSFDTLAMQTDAATRATVYADSIKKGMSEAQAQFRALEIQNFSRRGLSPTMQWLNTMVPFFNAQVQGLDVVYRALRGRLPFEKQLELRKKLIARGTLLTMTALAYAIAMQDDEDYKKLPPDVRYSNFLIRVPGVKDFVAVPIPYEVGLMFKALPEMLVDMASKDTESKEALKGIGKLIWQSVPSVTPAATKPWIEAALGMTPFGPIETAREKASLEAGERFREKTPEVLKVLGGITGHVGVSPLMLEHFVRSYTSALGVSLLRTLDPMLRPAGEGEKASQRESDLPFVGGLFKSTEGRYLVDRAYERMQEVTQAVGTYEKLMERGKAAEAREFAQRKADLLAAADMAGVYRKSVGENFKNERAVRESPYLSQAQKDLLIERMREARNRESAQFYGATERLKARQPA